MNDRAVYEAPALAEIGTLHELTLQTIIKNGSQADVLTGINIPGQGQVGTGSVTLIP